VAILPLVKKDGLPEISREILSQLRAEHNVQYDEKDAIGKRYRRHDAIGTPICLTVDQQTKENQTVTLRHRDTMEQERVSITELNQRIADMVKISSLLAK
jgi:glycyl-tRNA synthetase